MGSSFVKGGNTEKTTVFDISRTLCMSQNALDERKELSKHWKIKKRSEENDAL